MVLPRRFPAPLGSFKLLAKSGIGSLVVITGNDPAKRRVTFSEGHPPADGWKPKARGLQDGPIQRSAEEIERDREFEPLKEEVYAGTFMDPCLQNGGGVQGRAAPHIGPHEPSTSKRPAPAPTHLGTPMPSVLAMPPAPTHLETPMPSALAMPPPSGYWVGRLFAIHRNGPIS